MLQTDANDNKEGYTLNDRFELVKLVGAGGMSIVYKALDRRKLVLDDCDPYIAVKILKLTLRADQGLPAMLQQEAENCRRLIHPNIVRVYDFHRDGTTIYIVMEYLYGAPLTQQIRSQDFTAMATEEALNIITNMGAALAFAHEQRIIHCDFKPANIFLTDSGEIKLIDFGLSRVFNRRGATEETGGPEPTTTQMATLGYTSPEILEGYEPDPRDDIYSLACTAYELLAGSHPFDYQPATKTRDAGIELAKPAQLSRRHWQALQNALAFDRNYRTPTVAQFLKDINGRKASWISAVLNQIPGTESSSPTISGPVASSKKRGKSPVTLALVGFLGGFLGFFLGIYWLFMGIGSTVPQVADQHTQPMEARKENQPPGQIRVTGSGPADVDQR